SARPSTTKSTALSPAMLLNGSTASVMGPAAPAVLVAKYPPIAAIAAKTVTAAAIRGRPQPRDLGRWGGDDEDTPVAPSRTGRSSRELCGRAAGSFARHRATRS